MSEDPCTDLRDMFDAQAADFQRQQDRMIQFYREVADQVLVLAGASNLTSAPAIREGLDIASARRRR